MGSPRKPRFQRFPRLKPCLMRRAAHWPEGQCLHAVLTPSAYTGGGGHKRVCKHTFSGTRVKNPTPANDAGVGHPDKKNRPLARPVSRLSNLLNPTQAKGGLEWGTRSAQVSPNDGQTWGTVPFQNGSELVSENFFFHIFAHRSSSGLETAE
jgi:hypothetical protein